MSEIIIKSRTLKSGKVVYEYAFEIASVDGKRKRKTKCGFKTKKEAREAGKIAQQAYESIGQPIEPSSMSYSDFLDQWIENDIKISCKSETVKGYEKKIRLYIKPNLREYRLKAITKDNLQQFITKLFNDGFSPNTISSIRGLLSKSFSYAVDRHYIQISPAVGLKTPKNAQPKTTTRQKPHVYIPQNKINEIFERFPEGTSAYIPLMLGYHCGLRLGEIYGLTWDDIDLQNKTLSVNRQVQWQSETRTREDIRRTNGTSESNGYWYFSEPKYKSYRIIDIDDELVKILNIEQQKQKRAEEYYGEYYKRYYSNNKLYYGGKTPGYTIMPMNKIMESPTENKVDFVCRREDGSYVSPRTTQHISSVIHKQLDFPEYDTHSLRHTHATMLMENGADMVYIQRRLGHKDVSVTMNIYTNHMTEKITRQNNEKLNNMFAIKS